MHDPDKYTILQWVSFYLYRQLVTGTVSIVNMCPRVLHEQHISRCTTDTAS